MRYVATINGIVTEVREGDSGPEPMFYPYNGEVQVGWLHDGARYIGPNTDHAATLLANKDTTNAMTAGYSYKGTILSTSITAQLRWTALYVARDVITYPILVWNADDTQSIEIKDAAEVASIFTGMATTLTMIHQAGARTKIDIGK